MKTIFFLILLLIVPCLTIAEQDALEYLYEPVIGGGQQSMPRRIEIHALNTEFDAAISLIQKIDVVAIRISKGNSIWRIRTCSII